MFSGQASRICFKITQLGMEGQQGGGRESEAWMQSHGPHVSNYRNWVLNTEIFIVLYFLNMLKNAHNKRWRGEGIFMAKDKNYTRNSIWETKHNRVFQNSYQGPSLISYLSRVLVSCKGWCFIQITKKASTSTINELSNTEK